MSSLDDTAFRAGLVLDGRYRLDRPLGEGGMGTVWVAHQLTLGRAVAVKALRKGRAQDQARLEREARLLAAVRHPAIVQIFDFGRTADGLSYVVMELVEGPTLDARLAALGRISCEEAVSLLLPLLDGLAAVHAADIVHRDIKPANILLAIEGAGSAARVTPKLLDFGIAKSDVGTALTVQGDLIGTPAYMAPEQFSGGAVDARADLWAIGALLYDMIAGEPPFVGSNLFELMRRVKDEPPAFPRMAAGLDGKLWTLLTELLRKGPSERPPSANALRQRLTEWLSTRGGPRDLSRLIGAQVPTPRNSPSALPTSAPLPTDSLPPEVPPPAPVPTPTPPQTTPLSFDALIKSRLGSSSD